MVLNSDKSITSSKEDLKPQARSQTRGALTAALGDLCGVTLLRAPRLRWGRQQVAKSVVLCYSYAAAGYQHRLPPCIQSKSLMKQFGLVFSFLSPALRGLRWAPPGLTVCSIGEQLPAIGRSHSHHAFPGLL